VKAVQLAVQLESWLVGNLAEMMAGKTVERKAEM
jgi:hypothetical protein